MKNVIKYLCDIISQVVSWDETKIPSVFYYVVSNKKFLKRDNSKTRHYFFSLKLDIGIVRLTTRYELNHNKIWTLRKIYFTKMCMCVV